VHSFGLRRRGKGTQPQDDSHPRLNSFHPHLHYQFEQAQRIDREARIHMMKIGSLRSQ
jgi:hypothetical protein